MAHIAHQPGPVCLEGGVSRWLVGVVVGLGTELLQRPQAARAALLPFECLRKRAAPGPPGAARQGQAGMAELRPCSRGGAGGEKPLLCHNPQASSNVQEETHS
jgi:hypothetical protein